MRPSPLFELTQAAKSERGLLQQDFITLKRRPRKGDFVIGHYLEDPKQHEARLLGIVTNGKIKWIYRSGNESRRFVRLENLPQEPGFVNVARRVKSD
jgi:hypothetical protein